MKRVSLLAAAMMAATAGVAQAGALDLGLNNDTFAMEYRQSQPNYLGFNLGWVHRTDTSKGDYPKGADLYSMGLNVTQQSTQQLQVSLGAKAIYLDYDNGGDGALALGGSFRYGLPGNERVGIGGRLYFAPRVTSFSEMQNYLETGIRLDYLVMIRQAAVYVGYRNVTVDYKTVKNVEFDNDVHVGMELLF